jgi:hypothetical protein
MILVITLGRPMIVSKSKILKSILSTKLPLPCEVIFTDLRIRKGVSLMALIPIG